MNAPILYSFNPLCADTEEFFVMSLCSGNDNAVEAERDEFDDESLKQAFKQMSSTEALSIS